MSDKILVTGADGQLGTELKQLLLRAVFTGSKDLDITNSESVKEFVADNEIDTIINCAAYNAVDKAEDEVELANKVNAVGPEHLAKTGCKVIHISPDYVFDGRNYKPYQADDDPNPISVYGQTKRAGEKAVLSNSKVAIVIRTAWLYSTHGNNFVKTIRHLCAERESLSVVDDQIGTPTYAKDLANAIVAILPRMCENNRGVYHYTNEGVCSWYDFAREIMELSNLNCKVCPIPSSAYPAKAARPFYSVLDKSKIKTTFDIEIPHWKESLKLCLKQF